jgi:superfamily I DNA and/or RNA helicase
MDHESSKDKLKQIFTYLRELNKIKTPPVSDETKYSWSLNLDSLPSYPSIQRFNIDDPENTDGVILKIKRPQESDCPKPPSEIKDWLESGWEKLVENISWLKVRNAKDKEDKVIIERFEDIPKRTELLNSWIKQRSEWVKNEKPVREAGKVYSDLFTLQGTLDRESEKFQLYITDGVLKCESQFGVINHPILLKKIEIDFNPEKPEFTIYDSEDQSELYSSLLRFHEFSGDAILECKNRISEKDLHPASASSCDEFFKYFISRFFIDGEFYPNSKELSKISKPHIYREPKLILSPKSQGYAEALEKLVEAISEMNDLPEALLRIIGLDFRAVPGEGGDSPPEIPKFNDNEVDFLLTKPTNKEQERVIEKLEKTGSVLVQGPPGTGKSHTIANIVGHLLANGKKVLVSSHTSKALKVVREKVVEELRPLCVSVLDNDQESKTQLSDSINKIVNYHSRTDISTLEKEISQLKTRRDELKAKLKKCNQEALEIKKNEYADIVLAGEGVNPSEAAKIVNQHFDTMLWIPSPVKQGAPLPLELNELSSLYLTNSQVSFEEEKALEGELPNIDSLLKPSEVKDLCETIQALEQIDLKSSQKFWKIEKNEVSHLEELTGKIEDTLGFLSGEKWLLECVQASMVRTSDVNQNTWAFLAQNIQDLHNKIMHCEVSVAKHLPEVPENASYEVAVEIHSHLKNGNSLGTFNLLFKPSWKEFLTNVKVIGGQPKTVDHFASIMSVLELKRHRQEICLRWEKQVVTVGGQPLSGPNPERAAYSFSEIILKAINWNDLWNSHVADLQKESFDYSQLQEAIKGSMAGSPITDQVKLIGLRILELVSLRIKFLRWKELSARLEENLITLRKVSANEFGKPLVLAIYDSLNNRDASSFEKYFNALLEVQSKRQPAILRKSLLSRLAPVAPSWAKSIENRQAPHNLPSVPLNPVLAWKVRQLNDILDQRHSRDYLKLQEEISSTKHQLEQVTASYVEKLAWRHQKLNTSHNAWQALQGWLQIQNRLTKSGKGKRDAAFLKESRKQIKEAKHAVPVWIMPLSKISENFDLTNTRFDVLILDEASQSDVSALLAFAIARQVIVVGDDKQVTPYAVGMEMNKVQNLIEEFLKGIPNAVLYDGKTSIYDLAQQSFGETIRLVEHFRCVPDIISFSNQLSYEGEIKPLREASSSPYKQHTIAHRVDGARGIGKTNEEEAWEIASLIGAMTSDPTYEINDEKKKVSFGVISLLGDEQAYLIESILKEHLEPSLYQERKILCGNSSQFQGDERDIVFISMVDSSDGTPLNLKQTNDFKKICNVAASRARNQLWVVHSLNPEIELKQDDLRLRLIKHAENPKAFENILAENHAKAESPFEKLVMADLIREGYKITPQWKVGAYRIDMVVIGKGNKKIAIECDGEKFHPIEKLQDDIYRQMVLERLGWKFIRIRGSEYYKNPKSAMDRVFAELNKKEIEKIGLEESRPADYNEDFSVEKSRILMKASSLKEVWKKKKESNAA